MIVDQVLLERFSKEILLALENGKRVPPLLFENWVTALIAIMQDKCKLDSSTSALWSYLHAQYAYHDKHKDGFDLGAVYGSLMYVDIYRNLQDDKNGG